MDAIISGRAGVALLVEGEVLSSFDVEDPTTLLPRRPADIRLLFGEAPDVQFLEDVDRAEAAQQLERAFNCASALDLALILFDPELTDDVRDDAADELERLLSDPPVVEYLENILYGRPLPAAADIAGALARCEGGRLPKLSSTLQLLEGYQPSIRAVCAEWDALPLNLFGGDEQKTEFQRVAVREGAFRRLAVEAARGPYAHISEFIVDLGLKPSITALRNHLKVLQQWISPFRPHAAAPRVRHEDEEFSEESSTHRERGRGRRRRGTAEEELNKIQGQLDLIISAMRQQNLAFARKITDEVVDYQRKNAKPIHVAKTLCNLATEAKALGIYSLQLELTERATQIAPDDAWSWAQYADALLTLQRPAEALKAYEQAESFGAGVVAKAGRAETLRALGRLTEALDAYDSIVAQHPENAVAKNGRAETLRALGRLHDALDAYDSVVAQHPEDVFAKTGRAETLRALGRLHDALDAYDSVVAQHPEDVVTKNGRAETLRALGRLKEALAAYDATLAEYPEDVVTKSGRAETLRALGRLHDALDAYDSVVAQHPENVVAKRGRAEVLKAQGRLDDALAAYDAVLAENFADVMTKTGRAETLRALGRLHDALDAYDSTVAQHPENVVAKAGRAETLRALGRLAEALDAYDSVVAQHPENVVAKRGRAEVLKAQGRLDDALAAYDAVLADNPGDVIARNGRSCVLVALRSYEEALQSLPDENPVTLGDWIGYHIRGMILLRTGRAYEALRIFERGVREIPFPSQREYFQSALAVAWLRLRKFREAAITLDKVTAPMLQPQANVLRLHSFGASGEVERAAAAYEKLSDKPWFIPDELVAELHRKYILKEEPRYNDDWVFERESDIFLFDPNQQSMSRDLLAA